MPYTWMVHYSCRVPCNKSIFTFWKRGNSLVRPVPYMWGIAVKLIRLSLFHVDDMVSLLFTFVPAMSTRALLSCFLFIRDHWLMLTLELQLIDVLHKIISQAGDLGWMAPLDSIQSTSHLFWYNYLRSPRFIAVVARGMLLDVSSALHRLRNKH